MSLCHPVRHTCEYDTYEKVTSHMCMSHVLRHIRKSNVTHVHESCLHVNASFDANGWVTSHVWMSHLTSECHEFYTFLRIWMSLGTHMYECGVPRIDVTPMKESSHTYVWVMSAREWILWHIKMCHVKHMNVTHMNMSRHTYAWVTSVRERILWHI